MVQHEPELLDLTTGLLEAIKNDKSISMDEKLYLTLEDRICVESWDILESVRRLPLF